jgi:hypothetical protein
MADDTGLSPTSVTLSMSSNNAPAAATINAPDRGPNRKPRALREKMKRAKKIDQARVADALTTLSHDHGNAMAGVHRALPGPESEPYPRNPSQVVDAEQSADQLAQAKAERKAARRKLREAETVAESVSDASPAHGIRRDTVFSVPVVAPVMEMQGEADVNSETAAKAAAKAARKAAKHQRQAAAELEAHMNDSVPNHDAQAGAPALKKSKH